MLTTCFLPTNSAFPVLSLWVLVSLLRDSCSFSQFHRWSRLTPKKLNDLLMSKVKAKIWNAGFQAASLAPHSSTLAWKIPWTEEPGRLQSMGSLGVGHDWATSLWLLTFMHWRRKWQPTPVFLLGESHGQRSLVGCRLWGRTESDTTEATEQQQQQF